MKFALIFAILPILSAKSQVIDPSAATVSFFPGPIAENEEVYPLSEAENVASNPQFVHKSTTLFIKDYYEPQVYHSHHNVDAYLKANQTNFLILNWGAPNATSILDLRTPDVDNLGPLVADFILKLYQHIDPKSFDILSYADGVELSRNVARIIMDKTNGQMKLARLTGLDPPNGIESDGSISDCADFVDVIHTNANGFGTTVQLGHIDFWPNGGSIQPGCGDNPGLCDRMRAWGYWAESVEDQNGPQFDSYPAASYGEFQAKDLAKLGEPVLMGVNCDRSARGNYYLNTNEDQPYAKGAQK